jgi:hypothetical protein
MVTGTMREQLHTWRSKTIRNAARRGVVESLMEDRLQRGMDVEDGMEQNGDRNDPGTASHYPGNYHVDNRLSHAGR